MAQKFQLFKLRHNKHYTSYAWANPGGVCFTSRTISPFGFVRTPSGIADGLTIQELRSKGFKKEHSDMTQEQLSKGWLI